MSISEPQDNSRLHKTLIADVQFNIKNAPSKMINSFRRFDAAYSSRDAPPTSNIEVSVEIELYDPTDLGCTLDPVSQFPIHEAPYPRWQLFAQQVDLEQVSAFWLPAEGFVIGLPAADQVILIIDPAYDLARVGEVVHLLLRNLACYLRTPKSGTLIHASVVAQEDGARLVIGPSGAGKTEALLHSIFSERFPPISNDRALVNLSSGWVSCWPSYLTVLPDTLQRYPGLLRHLDPPEHDGLSGISGKRFATLTAVVASVGIEYRYADSIRALHILTEKWTPIRQLRRANINNATDRRLMARVLEEASFDQDEPSFLPWHGMKLPCYPPDWEQGLRQLTQLGVELYLTSTLENK